MSTLIQQIIDKYQGSASQKVVNAVENAAARTGADFSQLMEKASTESGFNPSAKSSTSSATGLFQFIDSTWLSMVKEHGAQFGLGKYADQIQIKDGKPCVANCSVKNTILNLRKSPEISALMAGAMSTEDKQYLQNNTDGPVGGTEMYLAHFMGAGTAAKFLNARADDGSASATKLFPKQAHANKGIFFNSSGHARSLDQVYNILAKKNGGDTQIASTQDDNNGTTGQPSAGSDTTAPASSTHTPSPSDGMPLIPSTMAQALPSSNAGEIIWDTPAVSTHSGFSHVASSVIPGQKLSPGSIIALAQMQHHHMFEGDKSKPHYNS